MDTVSKERRSEIMSHIRSKGTSPEMVVRSLVYQLGYRYRLHCRDLPGTPDLVFRPKKKIILVHGCFWHGHKGCKSASMPKSNVMFWKEKIAINRKRDRKNLAELANQGWDVLEVWQCTIRKKSELLEELQRFLASKQPSS